MNLNNPVVEMAVRLKKTPDPIWTTNEVERFWAILEPYLRQLVSGEIPTPLDDFQFIDLDLANAAYQRKLFYQKVHDNMWDGKYSSAVANLKAIRRYSQTTCDQLINNDDSINEASDLEELKKIFIQRPLMK